MPTSKLNLPTLTGNEIADVARDFNALANAIDKKAGVPEGLATLGPDGKIPEQQLNVDTSWAATKQELATHSAETAQQFTNMNINMIDMAVELETLKSATLNGVNSNIFIETFQTIDDINLFNGIYDSTNKRLFV